MRWAGAIRRNRRLRAGKRIARSESIVHVRGRKSIGSVPLNNSELQGECSSALHAVQKVARLTLIAATHPLFETEVLTEESNLDDLLRIPEGQGEAPSVYLFGPGAPEWESWTNGLRSGPG